MIRYYENKIDKNKICKKFMTGQETTHSVTFNRMFGFRQVN